MRSQNYKCSLDLSRAILSEKAAKCNLHGLQDKLVRDLFIARMTNGDFQKKYFLEKPDDTYPLIEDTI